MRFVLVPLLGLWLTGAGCMLGCEGMVATAATAGNGQDVSASPHSEHTLTIVASGQTCPSNGSATVSAEVRSQSHNCCKRSRAESRTEPATQPKSDIEPSNLSAATIVHSGASSSGMTGDCPLAGSKTAVVAKGRRSEASAPQLVAHSYLAAPNSREQSAPLFTPLLLPNRGPTYLRCCVFLI